jgi:hypothetical protein
MTPRCVKQGCVGRLGLLAEVTRSTALFWRLGPTHEGPRSDCVLSLAVSRTSFVSAPSTVLRTCREHRKSAGVRRGSEASRCRRFQPKRSRAEVSLDSGADDPTRTDALLITRSKNLRKINIRHHPHPLRHGDSRSPEPDPNRSGCHLRILWASEFSALDTPIMVSTAPRNAPITVR